MVDAIIQSPIILTLLCGVLAALMVSLGYMSAYRSGLTTPAAMPAKVPFRSFARAALIVFVVLINAASFGLAHRLPVGSTLIAAGFLMLLFLPADEAVDGQTSGG